MIIDLIEVLNKEEDPEPEPDPKEIILDPDLRGPKCNGSSGSRSGTLVVWNIFKNSLLLLDNRFLRAAPRAF
jgi:hypothetical protein